MTRIGPVKGEPQPPPLMGVERVRECEWHSVAELTIPEDWPSGVYLAKWGWKKNPSRAM